MKPLRVLIVEDSEDDYLLLRRTLKKGGYEVLDRRVDNGPDMRTALAEETWDLVVSDYSMPDFSGLAALDVLKESGLDLPFIILSGAIGEDIAVEVMKAGAHDYVLKDNRARLLPAIERELREAASRRTRRAAERALLASAVRIKAIMENVADVIITFTADGRIEEVNATAEQVFGYTSKELEGQPLRLLFPPRAHNIIMDAVKLHQSTGTLGELAHRREYQALRSRGVPFPVELVVSVMELDDETRYVAAAHDITERKAAEAQLRILSEAVEQSPNMVLITGRDRRLEYVNPRFTQVTGFRPVDALGRELRALTMRNMSDEAYEHLWRTLLETGEWRGEVYSLNKKGDGFWEHLSVSAIYEPEGALSHFVFLSEDITDRKLAAEKIAHMANYDRLTDLPNKVLFIRRLNQAIAAATRRRRMVAVMFLDLDRFQVLNDSLGHVLGDHVLRAVTKRLLKCIDDGQTVAREGGDEFMFLLPDVGGVLEVERLAQRVLQALDPSFRIRGHELHLTASIGISVFPFDGDAPEILLKNADTAMFRAKARGGNAFQMYTRDMNERFLERLALESSLRKALDRGEIQPFFQPQVDLRTGRVIGVETLARWQPRDRPEVSPGIFIPVAEETGLIGPLSDYLLGRACEIAQAWETAYGQRLTLAFNVSARQFDRSLIGTIEEILDRTTLDPQTLELELTESLLMENVDDAIALMKALRDLGVRLSVDDFGTGYSSLSYLKRFPIDKLKIDQSFVRDLETDPDDAAIVSAVIALAHSLGLHVIAEGVESLSHVEFLRAQGCDEIQGYYVSPPVPASEVPGLIHQCFLEAET